MKLFVVTAVLACVLAASAAPWGGESGYNVKISHDHHGGFGGGAGFGGNGGGFGGDGGGFGGDGGGFGGEGGAGGGGGFGGGGFGDGGQGGGGGEGGGDEGGDDGGFGGGDGGGGGSFGASQLDGGWHVPDYEFKYGVKDPKTGDHKEQWEHRHHDHVKGEYWLHEPDGTKRIVEYTADPKTGFHAIVKKIGHAEHPHHYGGGY